MTELVSVVMSVYNENQLELENSIESILNQTYKNIEIIIILDNPGNLETYKILDFFRNNDSRIKILVNEHNIGLAESLNKGIEYSSGKYIARMDADDISKPERIEKQMDYMWKNEKCSVVSTNRIDIDSNGKIIKSTYKAITDPKNIRKVLPYGSVIVHPSVLMRKECISSVMGYRNFQAAQDYDLWLRLVTSGFEIHTLSEEYIYYRIRDNSITSGDLFKQYLHSSYARKLYYERIRKGRDSFSKENLELYLDKNGYNNEKLRYEFNRAAKSTFEGIALIKKKVILKGFSVFLKSIYRQPQILKMFLSMLKFKVRKTLIDKKCK